MSPVRIWPGALCFPQVSGLRARRPTPSGSSWSAAWASWSGRTGSCVAPSRQRVGMVLCGPIEIRLPTNPSPDDAHSCRERPKEPPCRRSGVAQPGGAGVAWSPGCVMGCSARSVRLSRRGRWTGRTRRRDPRRCSRRRRPGRPQRSRAGRSHTPLSPAAAGPGRRQRSR